ncbi:LysM peptidoglycan-binding domain-containing protein [Halalkalibacter oceani]|uniref:LysM peptidoglycan-binding domain-containing protein n=1 Tax=Halalkalibacter oceani TaxID=1653776 RepID=UPI00339553BC
MIIHVVRGGETLWQIAGYYNMNIQTIIELNQLEDPNQLVNGQTLIIPAAGSAYVVRPGDTLSAIAAQYGVSVQALIAANPSLNPNLLYPGETLVIPPVHYVVQPQDTLWHIANRFGTTVEALVAENQLSNGNLIYPGYPLIIPRPRPVIEVNAYTYQEDQDAAQTIASLSPLLTYMSPFAYMITETGELEPVEDELTIAAAWQNQVIPMMAVTNFTATEAGSNLAHTILASAGLQEQLLTNIVTIMREKGYSGVNIDFENVLPDDRELYNQFLERAVARLHPDGYFVSTAVAPKTSGAQAGLLYEAHDYEAHGRIVDFVILMTYEWGYRLGPPQAISPLSNMRQVVEYALSVMPPEKVFLGFQIYARDWLIPHVEGQEAETFSPQEAVQRAIRYRAPIHYDALAQSPFFRYTDENGQAHEVWFEDARSAQAKFDLIKEFQLRGVSYWALGYPYPQNWTLLEANFTIRKR